MTPEEVARIKANPPTKEQIELLSALLCKNALKVRMEERMAAIAVMAFARAHLPPDKTPGEKLHDLIGYKNWSEGNEGRKEQFETDAAALMRQGWRPE
jgi:hypothetical protein